MKSYTDLEQSKKLAEFLSLESADMYYHKNTKGDFVEYPHFNAEYKSMVDRDINYNDEVIPCWSLAALFSVLTENKICHYDDRYYCQYISEGGEFPTYSTDEYDNPVDACYEMIIHLNELNLL